jgi:hypothetical protein
MASPSTSRRYAVLACRRDLNSSPRVGAIWNFIEPGKCRVARNCVASAWACPSTAVERERASLSALKKTNERGRSGERSWLFRF